MDTREAMLKFMLAARRKRTDTQERYFYEWGTIHVALMLATPGVMQVFRRYSQHYSVADVADTDLPLPLSPMKWDNMADHWLASYDDLLLALKGEGYVARMQPHKFGDDEFAVALMGGRVLYEHPSFVPEGGVKLLLWLAPRAGVDPAAFARAWGTGFSDPLLASRARDVIRKYVSNIQRPVDAQMFQGTLFARGGVNEHAVIDELWFDRLEDLYALRRDGAIFGALASALQDLPDSARSFAMVTAERVIYDYVSPGQTTPAPAVLNPASLEARVAAQGFGGWNMPCLPRTAAPTVR